jgi:excisionase family DNA binding protein
MLPGQKVIRPAEHFVHGLDGPVVVLDARICAIIDRELDKFRREVRGQDPQLDHSLRSIRLAGIRFIESSAAGTNVAPQPEPVSQSPQQLNDDTVSTSTAATVLGITDRAVRKAIDEKRLPATKIDGRWRIHRNDLMTRRDTFK